MVKSIHPYEILREPIITEKSTALALQGKYVFEVHDVLSQLDSKIQTSGIIFYNNVQH